MKRLLLAALICLSIGHAPGMAQKASPYQYWGDLRDLSCSSWTPNAESHANGSDAHTMLAHAPEHAWAYGFIAGAGLMPPSFDRTKERMMRVDVRGIDERIDRHCAAHHNQTLEAPRNDLVKELAAMR